MTMKGKADQHKNRLKGENFDDWFAENSFEFNEAALVASEEFFKVHNPKFYQVMKKVRHLVGKANNKGKKGE